MRLPPLHNWPPSCRRICHILYRVCIALFLLLPGMLYADTVTITAAQGNVRAEPTTRSSLVTTVTQGAAFPLLESRGTWYHIRLPDGRTGWIAAALVQRRAAPTAGRGLIQIHDQQGQQVGLYTASYALVIGVSDYVAGWPDLPGVRQDVQAITAALEAQGFQVTVVQDPTRAQLLLAFDAFIERYGQGVDHRLLFYFAGHGHTQRLAYGADMGYLVPRDAPNPHRDLPGFLATALSMQQIEVYAKTMQAKHALFVFDSCFAGAIFALTRAVPEHITYKTSKPVRQFITAGEAGEAVPDDSIFRRQFIEALQGKGDVNGDGYVTGAELGEFLQEKVVNYSRGTQHPQYGKLRDPHLDAGDVVFPVAPSVAPGMAPYAALQQQLEQERQQLAEEKRQFEEAKRLAEEVRRVREEQERIIQARDGVPHKPPGTQVTGGGEVQEPPHDTTYRNSIGMTFMLIPAGTFRMGSHDGLSDEKPVREVRISRDFYLGQYEVTQGQWAAVMGNNPSRFQGEEKPVESVSWEDIQDFIQRLNAKEGASLYRLPTEAEWEYAARAGTTTRWSFGDDAGQLGRYAWYEENAGKQTHPVGQKSPNAWGLFDMYGNVSEWVQDWYAAEYARHPVGTTALDPGGPVGDADRVIRGCGWSGAGRLCRSASRRHYVPSTRYPDLGFRLVRAAP